MSGKSGKTVEFRINGNPKVTYNESSLHWEDYISNEFNSNLFKLVKHCPLYIVRYCILYKYFYCTLITLTVNASILTSEDKR